MPSRRPFRAGRPSRWWWPTTRWPAAWSPPSATPSTVPTDGPPPSDTTPDSEHHPRVVTRGGPLDDVTWQVLAHLDPTGRGLFTLVARQRGQHRATSGMGDHPLPGGRLLDTFAGDADGLPPFALLRAAPSVESVIVHGTHDTRYPIELSATDPTYNLRFGATPLRDHDWPLELTVRLDTGETWSAPYFTPSR